ncbi:MAG TPA: preprotein translocase subunit SecE [Candidatus Saccharimonadales bacterium]|nr:preprotein translocase subunit SecE [Candidatus Saccharimonadales bacterium]
MAEKIEAKKPKHRIVKQVETVREQVEKNRQAPPKKRGIVRLTLYYISLPFRIVGRGIKKVGRYIVPGYFKKSWEELKQVTWPTGRDTFKLTIAVIIFSILFGLMVTVVDFGLDKVFRKVLID